MNPAAVVMAVPVWLCVLYWIAGVVVLAEALNKLERTPPLRQTMALRERMTLNLKALAWGLLALGGAGIVAGPFIRLPLPTLEDVCVAVGFAALIVRTRIKEG